MSTLYSVMSSHIAVPTIPVPVADVCDWQSRILPVDGVVLCDAKVGNARGIGMLGLEELRLVHALADVINTESPVRIERALLRHSITVEVVSPLLAALNLELAVTSQRKKFVVIEFGVFKVRTFCGGVLFQHTLAK